MTKEEKEEKKEPKFQWQPLVELIIVLATVVGTTVPLYIHTDGKLHEAIKEMKYEMKDFHGRLCAIEERNKK
jgi:hypothetical protein